MFVRHILFSLVLLVSFGACNGPAQEPYQGFKHYILTSENKPTQPLLDVLTLGHINHDNSLSSIVQETQKAWLRPAGIEPFQMSSNDVEEDKRTQFMASFKKLALIDDIKPKRKRYCYCLVHGASLSAVRGRIAYVVKLWGEGVRFDQLVLLTGQRKLDALKESIEHLYDRTQKTLPIRTGWKEPHAPPKTETDMMKMVYDQADLPHSLRMVPLCVVDAQEQVIAGGGKRRPNTHDTVALWLKQNPIPGACLAISCQPTVAYQDTVMRVLLPTRLSLETVGEGCSGDKMAVPKILDFFARWLYAQQGSFTSENR